MENGNIRTTSPRKSRILSEVARDEILARLSGALGGRPEIVFAYVHGSFATQGPFRDIDLAVWVDPERSPARSPVDYEIDLGLDLQRSVGLPVDVRRLNEAPLGFRYHATRGHVILCRDDEARHVCVERFRDAYWDFQPVARAHLVEVLRG